MIYPINTIGSTAIDTMSVNPITGTVRVEFQRYCGVKYRLKASRRAILALMWNSDCSLGQWVNRHCLQRHVTVTV